MSLSERIERDNPYAGQEIPILYIGGSMSNTRDYHSRPLPNVLHSSTETYVLHHYADTNRGRTAIFYLDKLARKFPAE